MKKSELKSQVSKKEIFSKDLIEEKHLTRRYLIWCYKTTKEAGDRIDRKFTQLKVDDYLWQQLLKGQKQIPDEVKQSYHENLEKFHVYIEKKQHEAIEQKFSDKEKEIPQAGYLYLKNRLRAVEQAIVFFLGAAELEKIRMLYEEEMTRRILESKEHT